MVNRITKEDEGQGARMGRGSRRGRGPARRRADRYGRASSAGGRSASGRPAERNVHLRENEEGLRREIAQAEHTNNTLFNTVLNGLEVSNAMTIEFQEDYPDVDWSLQPPSIIQKLEASFNDHDHLEVYNTIRRYHPQATNYEVHLVAALRCERIRNQRADLAAAGNEAPPIRKHPQPDDGPPPPPPTPQSQTGQFTCTV